MSPPKKMRTVAKRKVVFSILPMMFPSASVIFPSASVKSSSFSMMLPASSMALPSSSKRSSVMMLILESRSYLVAISLALLSGSVCSGVSDITLAG